MEIEKMIGEKPLKIFQCYRMFYGELPEHKTDENYVELFMKCQAMMMLLSEFGYNIRKPELDYNTASPWYRGDRDMDGLRISSDLDASIGVINFELEGKSQEYLEEYYQESLRRYPCYDEELTSRIGGLVREYAATRCMDIVTVLRQMTNIMAMKRKLEYDTPSQREIPEEEIIDALNRSKKNDPEDNLEDMFLFLKEKFQVIYESPSTSDSILDPKYLEFVKKYLPFPEKGKEKVI